MSGGDNSPITNVCEYVCVIYTACVCTFRQIKVFRQGIFTDVHGGKQCFTAQVANIRLLCLWVETELLINEQRVSVNLWNANSPHRLSSH